MFNLTFDYCIDEFMVYCHSRQLREKTLNSYEQALRLFERWCKEQMGIDDVGKITESIIRHYINDLQERGKYTFYSNDKGKAFNFPDRRRDFRHPISTCTINNYTRILRVFFNWLDSDYVLKKNPMRKIRQMKVNRQAKEYIKDEDFKRLISALDKSYFSEHRDYAMIVLMLDNLIRILLDGDVFLNECVVHSVVVSLNLVALFLLFFDDELKRGVSVNLHRQFFVSFCFTSFICLRKRICSKRADPFFTLSIAFFSQAPEKLQ